MTSPVTTVGPKYVEGLDIVDVAKLVRKDVAAARRAGKLASDVKVSVRISRYSMGQTLIAVATLPRPEVVYLDGRHRHTAEATAVSELLGGLLADYQTSTVDHLTDYSRQNYFTSVSIDGPHSCADLGCLR
jgi:hypothetical protein